MGEPNNDVGDEISHRSFNNIRKYIKSTKLLELFDEQEQLVESMKALAPSQVPDAILNWEPKFRLEKLLYNMKYKDKIKHVPDYQSKPENADEVVGVIGDAVYCFSNLMSGNYVEFNDNNDSNENDKKKEKSDQTLSESIQKFCDEQEKKPENEKLKNVYDHMRKINFDNRKFQLVSIFTDDVSAFDKDMWVMRLYNSDEKIAHEIEKDDEDRGKVACHPYFCLVEKFTSIFLDTFKKVTFNFSPIIGAQKEDGEIVTKNDPVDTVVTGIATTNPYGPIALCVCFDCTDSLFEKNAELVKDVENTRENLINKLCDYLCFLEQEKEKKENGENQKQEEENGENQKQ